MIIANSESMRSDLRLRSCQFLTLRSDLATIITNCTSFEVERADPSLVSVVLLAVNQAHCGRGLRKRVR